MVTFHCFSENVIIVHQGHIFIKHEKVCIANSLRSSIVEVKLHFKKARWIIGEGHVRLRKNEYFIKNSRLQD